jgi:hypothetical protein
MRRSLEIGIFLLLGLSVLIIRAPAGEERIAVEELPGAVLEAARAKFPKAEIKGAAREVEDGKTSCGVMLTLKGLRIGGHHTQFRGITYDVLASGKLWKGGRDLNSETFR